MTLTEIITQITTFIADYALYMGAGVVVSLMLWVLRKFLHSGR